MFVLIFSFYSCRLIEIQVTLFFLFILVRKEMKCFLRSSKFKDQKELLDHYFPYHNIDQNNWFFQRLFQSNNKTFFEKLC